MHCDRSSTTQQGAAYGVPRSKPGYADCLAGRGVVIENERRVINRRKQRDNAAVEITAVSTGFFCACTGPRPASRLVHVHVYMRRT
jgi:hypothetical protein